MSKASSSQSATIEIPVKTAVDEQQAQLNAIYYGLKAHIRSTRGLLAARQFSKVVDPLFLKSGTKYEQLRGELERQVNLLLAQEAADLLHIVTR